jgi:hypothetical protein
MAAAECNLDSSERMVVMFLAAIDLLRVLIGADAVVVQQIWGPVAEPFRLMAITIAEVARIQWGLWLLALFLLLSLGFIEMRKITLLSNSTNTLRRVRRNSFRRKFVGVLKDFCEGVESSLSQVNWRPTLRIVGVAMILLIGIGVPLVIVGGW